MTPPQVCHREWFTRLPVRRLTVLLDQVSPGDDDEYRQEITEYQHELAEVLAPLGFSELQFLTDHSDLPRRLREYRPEFVLHLAEYGYKGSLSLFCCQIPALLESEGIPFSNVGLGGMVFSVDKHLLNEMLRSVGSPVPEEIVLHRDDIIEGRAQVPDGFPFPAFLKTRLNGGSVGIAGRVNIVERREDLERVFHAVLSCFSTDDVRGRNMDEWLLQEHLPGPEVTVGVVGNGADLDLLPIGMAAGHEGAFVPCPDQTVDPADDHSGFFWFKRFVPAELPRAEEVEIRKQVTQVYSCLACRDYARIDLRADRAGVMKLIDANVLPALFRKSSLAKLAAMRGQSFEDLVHEILGVCFDRCFPGWRTPAANPGPPAR
jgi:D-alanine-D-alanine ligase-like ATP-grasp enzyme